jgi:hypothetical protein
MLGGAKGTRRGDRGRIIQRRGEPAWRYAIGITQQVRGYRQPKLRYERVWKGREQVLDRPDEADSDDDLRLTQTHLEQISANAKFREVARFFESIKYLHLVPQLLRHPRSVSRAWRARRSLRAELS